MWTCTMVTFALIWCPPLTLVFFFFNDTATTEIYTLSLHDALPICWTSLAHIATWTRRIPFGPNRSEEHTSELQSRRDLVCRLLLEKKKGNAARCRVDHKNHEKRLSRDR